MLSGSCTVVATSWPLARSVVAGVASEAQTGADYKASTEVKEVRNMLNRTRLALGASPTTMPSRDSIGVSKVAAMIYTQRDGQLDAFFDKAAIGAAQHTRVRACACA